MQELQMAANAIIENWQWIVRLGAIVLAGAALHKYIFIPIKNFVLDIKHSIEKFNVNYPILDQMAKDFKPNGGNSLRDVVDRIEKSVYLFEQRYHAIIEFQEIGLFETDKDGRYLWVSDKWLEITNQSWADASNNGWIAQVSSSDRDKVWHEWKVALDQGRQFSMKYLIHNNPSGVKIVSSFAIPIKDKAGNVLSYSGRLNVITQVGSAGGGQYAG